MSNCVAEPQTHGLLRTVTLAVLDDYMCYNCIEIVAGINKAFLLLQFMEISSKEMAQVYS